MFVLHPGYVLKRTLEGVNISNREFALKCNISESFISQMINGKKDVPEELIFKFAEIFGVSAEFWHNLIKNYEFYRLTLINKYGDLTDLLEKYPYSEIEKQGFVHKLSKPADKIIEILRFFNVATIEALSDKYFKEAFFKANSKLTENKEKIQTWVRIVESKASEIETKKYNKNMLIQMVKEIRENITSIEFEEEKVEEYLVGKLKECGVAFVLLDDISGMGLWGYVYKDEDRIVLAQSGRFKDNGHFWFTFFHEVAHILNDLEKYDTYFDEEGTDFPEQRADDYARDILVPTEKYKKLISLKPSIQKVQNFAQEINLPAGIIVGILQHDKHIPYSHMNSLKQYLGISKSLNK